MVVRKLFSTLITPPTLLVTLSIAVTTALAAAPAVAYQRMLTP